MHASQPSSLQIMFTPREVASAWLWGMHVLAKVWQLKLLMHAHVEKMGKAEERAIFHSWFDCFHHRYFLSPEVIMHACI